jgi:hypothetical protein
MVIETIQYRVNWRAFHKGASFFVPCIDWREARRKVLRITDRLRLQVITKVVIEDGVRGLRVWRM